jgi:hypothetical protein
MGDAQALYQDTIDHQSKEFVAKFWLNTLYRDRGVTYFLFALDLQRTPLTGTFDALLDDSSGHAIPVYKTEVDANGALIKWWIDIANMPPAGTPIEMHATIGSTGDGQFPAGALVMPFDYHWNQINSTTGTPEQLYIFTEYTVTNPTSNGCSGSLCSVVGVHSPVPALGAVASLGAIGLAAAIAVVSRRRSR